MKHKTLAVGVVFLFIVTSVTPMVIGYTSDDVSSESDELLENLAFMCYDEHGSNERYDYYKEHLLNDYSNNDLEIDKEVEPVESTTVISALSEATITWSPHSHPITYFIKRL